MMLASSLPLVRVTPAVLGRLREPSRPPSGAASVISLASALKSLPRFWSRRPLLRWTLDHLL